MALAEEERHATSLAERRQIHNEMTLVRRDLWLEG
jgi:hypothetical protein